MAACGMSISTSSVLSVAERQRKTLSGNRDLQRGPAAQLAGDIPPREFAAQWQLTQGRKKAESSTREMVSFLGAGPSGQLPRSSHPEWSKVGEQVARCAVEDLGSAHRAVSDERSGAGTASGVRSRWENNRKRRRRSNATAEAGRFRADHAETGTEGVNVPR